MGLYYFAKGKEFIDGAVTMIRNNSFPWNDMFFVRPVYNELITGGGVVRIVPTEEWMMLGTPEDAKRFTTAIAQKKP